MAQFAPVARNSMPYPEILGPISAVSAALQSRDLKVGCSKLATQAEVDHLRETGKAALLTELYTAVELSRLQNLHEIVAR
ncbi:hypothetical protein JCM10295v2_002038 [Rhodotorula toruloides]